MKQTLLFIITVWLICLPTSSQCAEIGNLLRQVSVEINSPAVNINVQFKDHDIPDKSEDWFCQYTVTNNSSKRKSFSAELIIYNEVGLISRVAASLFIPYISPNETIKQLDVVHFPAADIANASRIKIVGVGLQEGARSPREAGPGSAVAHRGDVPALGERSRAIADVQDVVVVIPACLPLGNGKRTAGALRQDQPLSGRVGIDAGKELLEIVRRKGVVQRRDAVYLDVVVLAGL